MAERQALKSRSRDRDDDRDERRSSRPRDRDDDRPRSGGGLKRSSRSGGGKWGGYQERTREQLKARAEQTGGKFDTYFQNGIEIYRPKDGENTIRYLPPGWSPAEHYGFDVWVHSFIGQDGSSYLCLDRMKKEHCPICAASKEAKDAGDEDEAKQLSATKRVIAWVLDRNENVGRDGPKPRVYSQSWSFDRDIAALCDTKKGAIYIDNEEEGYDVSFRKTGKALNTRYIGVQIDRDPSPVCEDPDEQLAVLDYISENPLPDILKFFSAEHLQKVIEGTSEPKDEDLDDEKDRGRGRSRDRDDDRPTRRRTSRDRDEVDERSARRTTRERDRDEEEEAPRERTHRGRDDAREEEDRPRGRGRSTRDDREEDEQAPRSRRGRDEADEPDEKPRRTSSRDAEADDRPARRRSRDEDDDKPSRTRGRASSRDEVDEPESYEEDAVEEPEDEPEDRPTRRRR